MSDTRENPRAGCVVATLGSVHTTGLAEYLDSLDARITRLEKEQAQKADTPSTPRARVSTRREP